MRGPVCSPLRQLDCAIRFAEADERAGAAEIGIADTAQFRSSVVLGDREPEVIARGERLAGQDPQAPPQIGVAEAGVGRAIVGELLCKTLERGEAVAKSASVDSSNWVGRGS